MTIKARGWKKKRRERRHCRHSLAVHACSRCRGQTRSRSKFGLEMSQRTAPSIEHEVRFLVQAISVQHNRARDYGTVCVSCPAPGDTCRWCMPFLKTPSNGMPPGHGSPYRSISINMSSLRKRSCNHAVQDRRAMFWLVKSSCVNFLNSLESCRPTYLAGKCLVSRILGMLIVQVVFSPAAVKSSYFLFLLNARARKLLRFPLFGENSSELYLSSVAMAAGMLGPPSWMRWRGLLGAARGGETGP